MDERVKGAAALSAMIAVMVILAKLISASLGFASVVALACI